MFGTARLIADEAEKLHVLELLAQKFAPDFIEKGMEEARQKIHYLAVIDIEIDHITGKESIELVNKH